MSLATQKPCPCPGEGVMVEVMGLYDGGLYFECQHCGAVWHRWPEGDWRHAQAERYLAAEGA